MRRVAAALLASSLVIAIGAETPAEDRRPAPAAAPRRAVGLLVVWDTGAGLLPPDGRETGLFLGGLRPGDRVGFVAAGARPRIVQPLSEIAADGAAPAGYAIAAGLAPVPEKTDVPAVLETALEHLQSLRRSREQQALVIVAGDAGPDAALEGISSRLVLDDVIVHAVRVVDRAEQDDGGAALRRLAASTGGRYLAVVGDGSALGALALAYDSLRLAAADLARTQVDTEGSRPDEDFSFLDEKRSIEDIAEAASFPRVTPRADCVHPPLLVAAAVAAAALLLAVLAYLLFLGQRLAAVLRIHGDLDAILRDRASPSFARLSQAMSRLQRSWNEAEKHVQALSLDLEDYGIESWEIEKRLLDNYASLADSLFLLIDHLELQRQAERGEETDWIRARLRRILDDEGIHEIEAAPGDEADASRHARTGSRADASPPGTVLELVRRGWVKRRGAIGDEDLVLRKAEVIVSAGPAAGGGGEERDD